MNKFQQALNLSNTATPPIWFMRQAGRYHSHYQNLKKHHSFLDLCRIPELACETTMGPIDDFDFDAAILFSDILFPIELMGPDLDFNPGPQFSYYLDHKDKLSLYNSPADGAKKLSFQADTLRLIRQKLPPQKGLIGFVGGPLTLYLFAVCGSHKGDVQDAMNGMHDGRFSGFMDKLADLLVDNMALQAAEDIDCLAMMDSAAGTIDTPLFFNNYFPFLKTVIEKFKTRCPNTKLLYYGKNISMTHWEKIATLNIQAFGIDHSLDMPTVMKSFGTSHALQGNFAPEHMSLPFDNFRKELDQFVNNMHSVPSNLRMGWICGLGHGILPDAKEQNVRFFIETLRKEF